MSTLFVFTDGVIPPASAGPGAALALTYDHPALAPGQSVTVQATQAHTTAQVLGGSDSDAVTITNLTKATAPATITKAQGVQGVAVSTGDLVSYAAPKTNSGDVTVVGN